MDVDVGDRYGGGKQNMERFTNLRVILARGPCQSSLYYFNFSICAVKVSMGVDFKRVLITGKKNYNYGDGC